MEDTEKLLKSLGDVSADHEFYTSLPKDYKPGKHKYVIVMGSVMSGLGKGIFTSSLCRIMKSDGFRVSPLKFDGYLNVDAGTLNPFRHGEVFVLDDGTECDMDLGSYERFLGEDLTKDNYLTTGKIFDTIIRKERGGKYLGRDVQFIPHVTGEIKGYIRKLAVKANADITIVEVGGTIGDLENSYFIEAMRELAYEEGHNNVCFVTLTYIIEPPSLGEQKSKAAQLGIRSFLSMGIQPDIIACRATNPVNPKVLEKISIYSNVPLERVISMPNVSNIYSVPLSLKEQGVDKIILDKLELKQRHGNLKEWRGFVENMDKAKKEVTIGITGKYTLVKDSYISILKALEHNEGEFGVKIKIKWVETTAIEEGKLKVEDALKDVDGIIVPGGFGKRGAEGKIECIRYARENKMPYLGLCYGFQMAVVEFARNVCGLKGANSTEIEAKTPHPVIDILPEQKKVEALGATMRLGGHDVIIKPDTQAYKIYGNKTQVRERFRHRYECNPEYIKRIEEKGLVFSGHAPKGEIMQILELPGHPYFMGSQFHPEFTSKPLNPNPMYKEFVKAAMGKGKH